MADDRHRLVRVVHRTEEVVHLAIHPHRVGVQRAARQHNRYVVVWVRFVERAIYWYRDALVMMLECLNLAAVWRDDVHLDACAAERLHRLRQFRFLEAIRRNHRDPILSRLSHLGIVLSARVSSRVSYVSLAWRP